MYIALLLLSVAFAVLLFTGWAGASQPPAGDWKITTQREARPLEVHLVDINTADREELILLPGIGEKLADRIVAYREENGAFSSAEDLLSVSGIGEKTLRECEDYIVLEEVQP